MKDELPSTWVVHYKEHPDSPQWEETFKEKDKADRFAFEIFSNGGISIVIEKKAEI